MKNYVDVAVSKELRKKYDIRSIPICKGDIVKIRSGKLKGEGGKVIKVNHSRELISVEGVTSTKADGKQKERKIKPQKLIITKIDFTRQERLDRIREVARMKNFTIVEPTPEELEPAQEENTAERAASEAQPQEQVEPEESIDTDKSIKKEPEEEAELPELEEEVSASHEKEPEVKEKDNVEHDDTAEVKKTRPRTRKKSADADNSDVKEDSESKKGGKKKNDKQD